MNSQPKQHSLLGHATFPVPSTHSPPLGISMSLFTGAVFFPLFYLGGEERSESFLVISLLCAFAINFIDPENAQYEVWIPVDKKLWWKMGETSQAFPYGVSPSLAIKYFHCSSLLQTLTPKSPMGGVSINAASLKWKRACHRHSGKIWLSIPNSL